MESKEIEKEDLLIETLDAKMMYAFYTQFQCHTFYKKYKDQEIDLETNETMVNTMNALSKVDDLEDSEDDFNTYKNMSGQVIQSL